MIEPGWKVVDAQGQEVGSVDEVAGDSSDDIFNGLSISTSLLGKPRYVPSEQVGTITEGRVHLKLTKDQIEHLGEFEEPPTSAEILPDGRRRGATGRGRRRGADPFARGTAQLPDARRTRLAAHLSPLGQHARELPRQRLRVALRRRDDEDGVVPGERADDPFVLELVECARDRGRGAELGLQHDDVPCRRHLAAELTEDRIEDLGGIGPAGDVRQHVPRPAEGVVRLLETELADVARDRRLRDDTTGVGERVEQLELSADSLSGDEALDQALPLGLPQLHKASIRMQVWRSQGLVELNVMLRKLLWSALYGAFAALATIVSRRAASRIWRTLTGEEPPTKK